MVGGETNISIRQHNEIISLHIHKSQYKEPPPIFQDQLTPFLEAVFINRVARVYDVEQHVVEEGLEGWDRSAFVGEEGG
jgi:hypothetical protein